MSNTFFFDFETTGIYNFKSTPDDPAQPWPTQLAFVVFNDERKLVHQAKVLIKPKTPINEEAAAKTGITTAYATTHGISVELALTLAIKFIQDCSLVVAHNVDFDRQILESAVARTTGTTYALDIPTFCTMKSMTNVCKLPAKWPGSFKWPRLEEAYKHCFGTTVDDAHDALADVTATSRIYYWMVDNKLVVNGRAVNEPVTVTSSYKPRLSGVTIP